MTRRGISPGRPTARQASLITPRIIDAGWRVMLETGPEQLSIDRIAGAARVSKQTIYRRFAGKLELLQAIQADRIEVVLSHMQQLSPNPDMHAAFADLAHRVAQSLTEPETAMIDRLIDWIDDTIGEGRHYPNRIALRERMQVHIMAHLDQAATRWAVAIDDVPAAASFWLDALYGHTRAFPDEQDNRGGWADRFTRYFLRGVCRPG